jgi:hypothetical protein
MASPITITPTLKNESSVKFNRQLEAQKNEKVSPAEKDRIINLVKTVLQKSENKPHK